MDSDGHLELSSSLDHSLLQWSGTATSAAASHTGIGLSALVARYSPTLYRVAYSILRNPSDAEDAVQDTFLRVLHHQDRIAEIRDMRVWLVRIVWNQAIDRKRRQRNVALDEDARQIAQLMPSKELPADRVFISAQGHARLLHLIDALPRKEREVLLLSALDELNTVEIAAILRLTESTVRSRLFRARQRLQAKLGMPAKAAPAGKHTSAPGRAHA